MPEPGVMFEEPLATYFIMQNYGVTSCPATPEETDKEGAFATKCAEMVIMMRAVLLADYYSSRGHPGRHCGTGVIGRHQRVVNMETRSAVSCWRSLKCQRYIVH